MKNSIELSRRKVLGSIATVGAASAAAGAGTFAYFNDTESDSGNTIQAGTLDLTLGSSSTHLSMPGLAPGDSIGPASITLNNVGTLPADHVEATISAITNNDAGGSNDLNASQFARNLWITHVSMGGASGPLFKQMPGLSIHDTSAGGSASARANTGAEEAHVHRRTINGQDAVYVTSVDHSTGDYVSTSDYVRSLVDVSGENATIGDLADDGSASALSYDWWGGANNTNALPDEAFIVVETGSGRHIAFLHQGTTSSPDTDETWKRLNLAEKLDEDPADGSWNEFHPDVSDGPSQVTSISDPVSEFGIDATLQLVGFGYGNTGTPDQLEAAFSDLSVNGSTKSFRTSRISAHDLSNSVIDNMKGISTGGTRSFSLGFRLNPDVGNDFQNEGVDVSLEFTLNQNPAQ